MQEYEINPTFKVASAGDDGKVTTINKYAIVGAASVVTIDIPDYAVAVGNPARVIKYLDKVWFA